MARLPVSNLNGSPCFTSSIHSKLPRPYQPAPPPPPPPYIQLSSVGINPFPLKKVRWTVGLVQADLHFPVDHFYFLKMSMLSKLRCITVDVTGTLMAYKGELGDYYCMAAKSIGLPCPDYKRVHEGFKLAYTELARKHPCFGFAEKIPNIVWWKTCVRNSFVQAGYEYDEETFEKIFRRIYSTFGSSAPYAIFPDSQSFLRWVRGKGVTVGIVSNSEYRYQDVLLPALGLHQGSEWDFGVFSGLEGVEKPDPRMYQIALERAGNIAPTEALHIGDSMRKDYLPAKSVGMHALLLDRFNIPDAEIWRKSGAIVLPDLVAVQKWLSSEQQVCQ
ncbi:haloacid dehalogenase-like hydrolase domain-containing protein 3 [Dorcoceras hygrometricum]|uniref:Haloacid dehalogenase-like hydrolase domain-containing protein 3 n=1 Tax=Dorcoceras hygrometricum TaxID=472368 RepID=A0A2Z7D731_9LAMI|nr:haloacid dehalogenase-like hydrolase domain-containing protein 3 [Dorcoceras hygrometricum]